MYFLLCCTPLIDETNCTGDNQIVTINKALESFHLGWADILFIIADNTSVNPSIAKKVKKPIIGCQSHVLALAVKEYCKEHISLLVKMNDLCKKFRTAKYRGALRREGCDVNPKICGHKWGATYNMLETYFDDVGVFIESIVHANEWREFTDNHSFTPSERSALLQLKKDLSFMNSVSISIQGTNSNLNDVRCLFDRLLTKFNDANELHHRREDDKIVHNKVASKGLVKLQLTVAEKIEMIPFLMPNGGDYEDIDDIEETLEDDEETAEGWAHRTLSKNKKPRIDMKDMDSVRDLRGREIIL